MTVDSTLKRKSTNRFREVEKIGEGTYGTVFKAYDTISEMRVAVKKIRQFEYDEYYGISTTSIREIATLKELNHQNVVKLYDVFNEKNRLYLVFEFCDSDLKQLMDKDPNLNQDRRLIKYYLNQLITGIAYCHQRGVLHRDLKPENILVDQSRKIIKVADFGLARSFSIPFECLTDEVVTLWYRAPEILLGMSNYGTPIDIWAIGCIFAEMLTGKPLFPGISEIDELYKIFYLLGTPNNTVWPDVTELPDFSGFFPNWHKNRLKDYMHDVGELEFDLLSRMLILDPSKRISARSALQHPIFSEIYS